MKSIIRNLHLIIGLTIGLLVIVISITGSIYSFEEEFRNIIYKKQFKVKQQSSKLPLSALLDSAESYNPSPIKALRIKDASDASIEFMFKDRTSLYVNPYTGENLGIINKDQDFFGITLKIHRWLLIGETGKIITGISALLFLLMLISGIVLWCPKNLKALKQFLTIKSKASSKRINMDLHRVLGFYGSWVLLIVVLTGLIASFKWVEKSMYWVVGSTKQPREKFQSTADSTHASAFSIESAINNLKADMKSSTDYFISFPEDEKGVYKVFLRSDEGGFFKRSDQFTYDQYSGKVLKSRKFEDLQTGDKLRSANTDIHTGKAFGMIGQLLVFFSGLISASLPITGFIIWRNKKIRISLKQHEILSTQSV